MRHHAVAQIVFVICLGVLLGGCAAALDTNPAFAPYMQKPVALTEDCILLESVASNSGVELPVYWEGGQPTDLVRDDRMFTAPARTIYDSWDTAKQFPKPLYSVADYSHRLYTLIDARQQFLLDHPAYYRKFAVPAGTMITLNRIYVQAFTGAKYAQGTIHVPELPQGVKFSYLISTDNKLPQMPWEDGPAPSGREWGDR